MHEDLLTTPDVPRLGLSLPVLAAIALGGALGTVARYVLDASYFSPSGHFPTTTLLINLSGSLAIGLVIPATDVVKRTVPLARPFLVVGLLGGWTTYSTFAMDAVLLGKAHHLLASVSYLAATVVGGVALVAAGTAAAGKLVWR